MRAFVLPRCQTLLACRRRRVHVASPSADVPGSVCERRNGQGERGATFAAVQARGVMVQFEHLSDHAGDQLRRTAAQHHEAERDADRDAERLDRAVADERAARRRRPIWKRLLGISTPGTREAQVAVTSARQQLDRTRAQIAEREQALHQQGAGVAGERSLAAWLTTSLPDDWIGFGGYRNKKGEADLVLVGPPGIWVVEVKNRNAELFAHGDQWTWRKFDNYGNVVDRGPATDRGGRTWGQQAGQVAESLAWWLGQSQVQVPIRTAVVLVHPKASVGGVANPGVDVVTADTAHFLAVVSQPGNVDPVLRQQVAALIRRDHAHHARPQRGRAR